MPFATYTKRYKELQRFLRFLIVGAGGTILDFCLLTFFKEFTILPTMVANLISYTAGGISNFTFHKLWTYADSRRKWVLTQFGQFTLVGLSGLILNTLLVVRLEGYFNRLPNHPLHTYLPAKLIAVFCIILWNYFVNRYWTFKDVVTQ